MGDPEKDIEDNKLRCGVQRLQEMKQAKKAGRVVFYLDGNSEKVREVEVTEKI